MRWVWRAAGARRLGGRRELPDDCDAYGCMLLRLALAAPDSSDRRCGGPGPTLRLMEERTWAGEGSDGR
eukprot:767866-Hanusia_phi.AAC.4